MSRTVQSWRRCYRRPGRLFDPAPFGVMSHPGLDRSVFVHRWRRRRALGAALRLSVFVLYLGLVLALYGCVIHAYVDSRPSGDGSCSQSAKVESVGDRVRARLIEKFSAGGEP